MPKIIQATLDCYSGSCQNCHPPTWNCLSWRQAKQLVEKVTLYAGDIRMITTKMPKIIQATLDCYSGSCQNCHPPTWKCLSWRQAKQLVEKVTAFEGMWPDTTQYLTRFAIQAKDPDGKWTRKPLAYRESNNVHLLIARPPEICVNLVFKHIHAASSYTICRQFVPFIYCPL